MRRREEGGGERRGEEGREEKGRGGEGRENERRHAWQGGAAALTNINVQFSPRTAK